MSSEFSFKANPVERPVEARAPSSLAGTGLYLALAGAGAVHVLVLAILLFDANRAATIDPQTQEIPVEIVVEPPPQEKPEPPPPKADPSSAAKPFDEAPAFDAPRTANTEKTERDAPDKASKAPDAPTPTPDPQPSAGGAAAPADAAPTHAGEAQPTANAAEPTPDKPDAEVIKKSDPNPANSDQREAHADAKAEPNKMPSLVGEPFPAWSGGPRLPSYEPLPEVELGSAAEAAPIGGGNAKATYLTILYGLVMAHMHMPPSIDAQTSRIEGEISFEVDGAGKLIQRHVTRSSGSRELDSAALAAVAQAAPFPHPPQGSPLGLKFTYGAR